MKRRINFFAATAVLLLLLVLLSACSGSPAAQPDGQIYLYGEAHGVKRILDRELELWCEYYHGQNMRHLFIEYPYFDAAFLNLWMQADNDDILDTLFNDCKGSEAYNPDIKEFFQQVKLQCPETVFHGTDIGFSYNTTGRRFLQWLKDNGLEDSAQYNRTLEIMAQGRYYRESNGDHAYRENKMVENFIWEFDQLEQESVMGIYGGAHTELDAMDFMTQSVPCMATQLRERYGDAVQAESLVWLVNEPVRVDVIELNGKAYQAPYFGKSTAGLSPDLFYREFWRLENAYDDFKQHSKTGQELSYSDYPMEIESGQVFVVDSVREDGSALREYLRSDGLVYDDMPFTEGFALE